MMTYDEALKFIHGVDFTFCKPGLDRIKELCEKIGNPQKDLKFIHVGGTNGKGSFCSMLSCVLRSAGYKTGLYTSPYVLRFNERMQIDGVPISDERLSELCERVKPIAESMNDKPTEFELITAIAFLYFKEEQTDVVVLEVGMGGRLDATNVIQTQILSVITGIALDHTAYLGNTIEEIAAEKAGIIKHAPTLYGGEDEKARAVIENRACECGVRFSCVDYSKLTVKEASLNGAVFDYKGRRDVEISLLGLYQPKNAAIVIDAVDALNNVGLNISDDALYRGLKNARWPARFEIVSRNPLIIFDGAHNPQGICAALESIRAYFDTGVHIITGVLKDKDYEFIAKKLATVAEFATTLTPSNPRALEACRYARLLESLGVPSEAKASVEEALQFAIDKAKKENRALICLGSLYTYAEVIEALNNRRKQYEN